MILRNSDLERLVSLLLFCIKYNYSNYQHKLVCGLHHKSEIILNSNEIYLHWKQERYVHFTDH
jgi:hypothetical protein